MRQSQNFAGLLTLNLRCCRLQSFSVVALSTSTAATLKFKMGLDDFLQTWGQKSWKDLGLLEPEPSTSKSDSFLVAASQ